ncbi:hypothetical protein [Paenibacillus xerothermodurans]|uniref:Uncharacterized protein n=1 Tax=Paenibacillus xerothermodurans TaxID=1977292 RepID=A0A2W1N7E8_PAEXE|nr:hypothetical protein [Paenibacillus xerothermodurans]PZE20337.1 hypothetical protein CBW46_012895 [Paenibacillus xerothermodurans]
MPNQQEQWAADSSGRLMQSHETEGGSPIGGHRAYQYYDPLSALVALTALLLPPYYAPYPYVYPYAYGYPYSYPGVYPFYPSYGYAAY